MLNPKQNDEKISEETKKNMVVMLKLLYDKVDWRVIARRQDKFAVFTRKIRASSNQESIPRFIDKMIYELSLESVAIPAQTIEQLDQNKDAVLEALQKEVNYYVALATDWR